VTYHPELFNGMAIIFSGYLIELRVLWRFAPSRLRQGGLGANPQRLAIFGRLLQK